VVSSKDGICSIVEWTKCSHYGEKLMGGANQTTSPPAPATARSTAKASASAQSSSPPISSASIRSHENISKGEVHFHDDGAGMKCAIETALFFDAYHAWRKTMNGELTIPGKNTTYGHSSVTFTPYVDDDGKLQIAQSVQKVDLGDTIRDMDVLAKWGPNA